MLCVTWPADTLLWSIRNEGTALTNATDRNFVASRRKAPASIPGNSAPPTQFSSAALSSPSGVIVASGGGLWPQALCQSLLNVLAAHFCMIAICVSVSFRSCNPLFASDSSLGMWLVPVAVSRLTTDDDPAIG